MLVLEGDLDILGWEHSDIDDVYRPSYRNGQVELHIPYGNKAT